MTLDKVQVDDPVWRTLASAVIAAMFALLLDEKRELSFPVERLEEIRKAIGESLVALTVHVNDGVCTIRANLAPHTGEIC